jgi:hypothetical protein
VCEVKVFFGRHKVAVDGAAPKVIFLGKKEGKTTLDTTAHPPAGDGLRAAPEG